MFLLTNSDCLPVEQENAFLLKKQQCFLFSKEARILAEQTIIVFLLIASTTNAA